MLRTINPLPHTLSDKNGLSGRVKKIVIKIVRGHGRFVMLDKSSSSSSKQASSYLLFKKL